jgi:NAD(P)-dependent dehydrogenase (short-subunit alcohol dehydrogenase family)
MLLPADITDPASVAAAATTFRERWGVPDVLVNCARHTGPGHMDQVADTPIASLRMIVEGNFFTPFLLCQMFAPAMAERGSGDIFNFTSMSAVSDPRGPAGQGGWGASYGCSKAAIHRLAGILHVELGSRGVRAYNIDPGFTITERIIQDMGKFGFAPAGMSPDVTGAVVAWLATHEEAAQYSGRTIMTPMLCADLGLIEGWDRSQVPAPKGRMDGAAAAWLEAKAVSD